MLQPFEAWKTAEELGIDTTREFVVAEARGRDRELGFGVGTLVTYIETEHPRGHTAIFRNSQGTDRFFLLGSTRLRSPVGRVSRETRSTGGNRSTTGRNWHDRLFPYGGIHTAGWGYGSDASDRRDSRRVWYGCIYSP